MKTRLSSASWFHGRQMASLRSLAGLKAIFFDALILIGSPVCGLRPMRAARLRTCRMPRPLRRILSPFFRLLVIISTICVSISLAWRFGNSCTSDNCSAMWRRVRIGPADGLPDFFAALETALAAAFGAAAFVGLLAAPPAVPAALPDIIFDAA